MIPSSLKLAGREIPILVDSSDDLYLTWVEQFIPRLTNSLDGLVEAAIQYLKEEKVIGESDSPPFGAVLFSGGKDDGWWYSLMFSTPDPVGVIFEGNRPTGTVFGAA